MLLVWILYAEDYGLVVETSLNCQLLAIKLFLSLEQTLKAKMK